MASRTAQPPLHKKIRRTTHKHVKMAVLPHKHNQYKPHLIRRQGLAVVFVAVLLAQLIGNIGYFRSTLGAENTVQTAELLDATNRERTSAGLAPLNLDARLSDAAYLKAQDMLTNQYWSHDSPTGVKPWKWLSDAGYNYSYAGENLARNFETSQTVVNAWMASPSHRENILKSQYQDVGFATVEGELLGKPTSLVVAMYGTPVVNGVGAVMGENFSSPIMTNLSLAARAGMSLQSMSPVALSSVILLLLVAVVALLAQVYHRRIPKYLQSRWNRHHGLAKGLALSSLVVVVLAIYGTTGTL